MENRMNFQTSVELPAGMPSVSHADHILLMGSCFAENIGRQLMDAGFQLDLNPFGILYNPLSVSSALREIIRNKEYNKQDLFAYKDLWHSPMHHGSFSAFTPEETLHTINSRLHHAYKKLPELNWLMVTMGTAYVYKQKESGQVVANCHQLPESHFLRYRLSVEEIVEDYTALITEMSALNPDLKWLFTVSPIRHIRDGMHANQLSKSTLLLAIDRLQQLFPERVFYFPSYEIILDELRDYRFYADDMLHPSPLAIRYLWERFSETFFSSETKQVIVSVQDIRRDLAHKPFHPESEAYQRFLGQIVLKIERLIGKYPYLDFQKETEEDFKEVENGELRVESSMQHDGAQPTLNSQLSTLNFLIVPNPLKALQKLAETHRDKFKIPVIGITGSNGKTIVKEWLHQLLSPDRCIVRSPRSYNSQIGVPLSVWQLSEEAELGIFEAGISEMGEMGALKRMIKPTIGILTNIGGAHQENFFSLQEKCMEKLTLFKDCDVVIYNGDNELISNCVAKSMLTAREIAWSRTDIERPLYISRVTKKEDHTVISYRYLEMDNTFCIPFIDDASIENALNCLAACLYLMTPADQITERMARLEPIAMRLEVKEGKNNCVLINDSYNSDLASLDIALDFLVRRSEKKGLKRTLILSDILETGQSTATLYRRVAQLVQSKGINKLIGVGQEISSCSARFNDDLERYFFPNTEALLASNILKSLHSEVILVKGSRVFNFDLVSEALELKVHETILEVNLGAMVANLNHYRSMLRHPETKMICMVKASAYGAGSYEIAKSLQEHHVDYLAVAVADEGSELRKAGITASIIIMDPELTAFKTMFDYKLEPEVYNFHLLDALIKAAEKEGITNFPIHVKLDTGMHRLGFAVEDIPLLIRRLKNQSAVIPRSVFSHFVGSDSSQFDAFTRGQIELFEKGSQELQAAFSHKILRHICNTAGIERFPEAQYDMVRLGIGLYGVSPIDNSIIHNVSTLKTTILQIRDVPQEDTVGYSRMGHLVRPSRIAAIPIGYADGLNRHLGRGNAYCLVNGKKAPYVGNICMDVCMIDVTDIDCREGDQAIIFGDDLPITVLSDKLETIPYEVLTSISTRVKRVYYQD